MLPTIPTDASVKYEHDDSRRSQGWLILRTQYGRIGGRRFDGSYPEGIEKAETLNGERRKLEAYFQSFVLAADLPPTWEFDSALFLPQ